MTHADTAAQLVLGPRNSDYGSPHPDFSGIAHMWTGLLNTRLSSPITAVDVGLMMTALKLRRHAHKPKDDNLVDAHGYLDCIEWIERGTRPEPLASIHASTIEDVCTGARMTCNACGQSMPCMCEHRA